MAEELNIESESEVDGSREKRVRRWLLEIKLAQKREKDWRSQGKTIWKKYRTEQRRKSSFNILWANTETLRPALYNSPPKPDVRRRFRQDDMLGKATGELLERSISYCVDAYDHDQVVKQDVLDALLPGRGLSRVRYIPSFKQTSGETHDGELSEDEAPFEGNKEELEFEQCSFEHVAWDDFLHGPGRTWDEVTWIAFRHRLTRDDLIDWFGEEIGNAIDLDATDDDDIQRKENEDIADIFKRAQIWEIWDKDKKQVFFISASYKKDVLYAKPEEGEKLGEPPLKLKDFWPVPRPLILIEDTESLIPVPLFEEYKEQAEELDKISYRIIKVINACRARGMYDSTLTEFSELMTKEDNDLMPVSQARAYMNNGGLDKAIWWMPVEQLAKVLQELYASREQCKAVIYELTGISDIVRGDTNPNETLGAQQLKANYSSIRLQRMQREVQRYIRDQIRLMAEVIGEHFSQATLSKMTGMNFPTASEKEQMTVAMQAPSPQMQQNMDAVQNALKMPTWEDIMGVLQSDMQREFRVDVETNSTVAETLSNDMQGLQEVLTGITRFWDAVGPAVMAGAVTIDAVKAITMVIVRRARMGLEVEDALETGMQAPKPQADPNAAKAQVEAQKMQFEQMLAARDQQHQQLMAQREAELNQQKQAQDQQMQAMRQYLDNERRQTQMVMDSAFEKFKALLDARTKIEVAEITAGATVDAAQISGAREATQQ